MDTQASKVTWAEAIGNVTLECDTHLDGEAVEPAPNRRIVPAVDLGASDVNKDLSKTFQTNTIWPEHQNVAKRERNHILAVEATLWCSSHCIYLFLLRDLVGGTRFELVTPAV